MGSPESARNFPPPENEKEPTSEHSENIEAMMAQNAAEQRETAARIEAEVTPEHVERVKKAVDGGIELAYDTLNEDYENPGPDKADQELKFHNRTHTEGVVNRTKRILGAIRGVEPGEKPSPEAERVVELGRLIAAFHDVRNMSRTLEVPDPVNPGFTKKMRARARPAFGAVTLDGLRIKREKSELGGEQLSETEAANLQALEELGPLGTNELDSANELLAYMKNQKGPDGQPLFTERDMADVQFALAATVPGWDVKMGTVQQINLSEWSRELARSVALADLGEAGTSPEAYLNAGDALFLEDNPDIGDAIDNPDAKNEDGTPKYDEAAKARFAKRIVAFSQTQGDFALGRSLRLDKELDGLTPEEQGRVREVFDSFGDDEVELRDDLDKDGKPTGGKRVAGLKPGVTPKGSIGRAFQIGQERAGLSFDQLREQLRANTTKHRESFGKQE